MASNDTNAASEEKKGDVKIVVIGDGAVGKTSMIASYATNTFDEDHVPTIYDIYKCIVEVNERKVEVQIHDTAGQEDYDRARPIAYPGTTCFILVFSVDSQTSFSHVDWKWMKEIEHFAKNAHTIVVANQIDKRQELPKDSVIHAEQGLQMAKTLKADAYLECSARTREGLKAVFDRAIALSLKGPKKNKKKKCYVL